MVDVAGLRRALTSDGVPRVVNFWATWCGPCVAELPALQEAARELEGERLEVVAVSMDIAFGLDFQGIDTAEEIGAFALEREIELAILAYDGPIEALLDDWDLSDGALPFTIALDESGAVVDREMGEATRARFVELGRSALRKP